MLPQPHKRNRSEDSDEPSQKRLRTEGQTPPPEQMAQPSIRLNQIPPPEPVPQANRNFQIPNFDISNRSSGPMALINLGATAPHQGFLPFQTPMFHLAGQAYLIQMQGFGIPNMPMLHPNSPLGQQSNQPVSIIPTVLNSSISPQPSPPLSPVCKSPKWAIELMQETGNRIEIINNKMIIKNDCKDEDIENLRKIKYLLSEIEACFEKKVNWRDKLRIGSLWCIEVNNLQIQISSNDDLNLLISMIETAEIPNSISIISHYLNDVTMTYFKTLLQSKNCPQNLTLAFVNNNISFARHKLLAQGIAQTQCQELTLLLASNIISKLNWNNCLRELGKAFDWNQSILKLKLSLRNNPIGPDAFKNLIFPKKLVAMELDCADNRIGEQGAEHLAKELKLANLEIKLDLSNNSIGDKGVVVLANALTSRKCAMLNLGGNQFGSSGVDALVTMLNNLTVTEFALNLSNTGLNNAGAIKILNTLKDTIKIDLDLSQNPFDDAFAEIFVNFLKSKKYASDSVFNIRGQNFWTKFEIEKIVAVLISGNFNDNLTLYLPKSVIANILSFTSIFRSKKPINLFFESDAELAQINKEEIGDFIQTITDKDCSQKIFIDFSHTGTKPADTFIYINLNYYISKTIDAFIGILASGSCIDQLTVNLGNVISYGPESFIKLLKVFADNNYPDSLKLIMTLTLRTSWIEQILTALRSKKYSRGLEISTNIPCMDYYTHKLDSQISAICQQLKANNNNCNQLILGYAIFLHQGFRTDKHLICSLSEDILKLIGFFLLEDSIYPIGYGDFRPHQAKSKWEYILTVLNNIHYSIYPELLFKKLGFNFEFAQNDMKTICSREKTSLTMTYALTNYLITKQIPTTNTEQTEELPDDTQQFFEKAEEVNFSELSKVLPIENKISLGFIQLVRSGYYASMSDIILLFIAVPDLRLHYIDSSLCKAKNEATQFIFSDLSCFPLGQFNGYHEKVRYMRYTFFDPDSTSRQLPEHPDNSLVNRP